ncbi:MAG: hypothetical protein HC811_00990 [Flammeovirgaceae bacterium]|nr:hypothetical protein [Flammeovirgaceae bacterium]
MQKGSDQIENNFSKKGSVLNIASFLFVLLLGGVLSIVIPKENVSQVEQRALTPFPQYSFYALVEEKYTDSLDLYYADNFPFRENWVVLASSLRNKMGFRENDMMIYNAALSEVPVDTTKIDSVFVNEIAKPELVPVPAEKPGGIIIYNGRAFQRFQGSETIGLKYAEVINEYRAILPDCVTVYSLIIPGPNDFYLPEKFTTTFYSKEENSIDFITSNLDSSVVAVDAYSEIKAHQNEYLYFHTDHHWTVRGAYYAYRAFCKSAHLGSVDMGVYQLKVRRNYFGSLYNQTLDARLKANPDSVEYFRIPVETQAFRYIDPALDTMVKSSMIYERIKGPSYLTFLGGDHPLIHIKTTNTNNRRIFIFKDSFGNAFVPFLAMHYQDIFVADYRYFNKNVPDFIKRNKITDLLFIHNTFVVNSKFVITRERYLKRSSNRAPRLIPLDSVDLEYDSIPEN